MAAKGERTRAQVVEAAEALILEKGYAGTSLEDVLKATGLTKGAFFHHFKNKAELGQAVVERYAEADYALFAQWAAEANAADDPLERVMIFLRRFEDYLDSLGAPFPGCVFASYTYERQHFSAETHAYIRERLEDWTALFEEKFAALIAARAPARPIGARALAEMIVTLIEGGFVMANAHGDAAWLQRQSRAYRLLLTLLFASEPGTSAQ